MEWLLAGAMVLYALQAAYSTSLDKALEQTVFFYVPFALLFAVLRDVEWSPQAAAAPASRCWSGSRSSSPAIGFVEYATRSLLLNPKVIASNELEEYFRVNSLFFDPNIYGRFLALVMLGLAGVLLWERRPRTVGLATAALAVLWGGLVLTLSQSSFASLLAGLFVLAALRFPLHKVLPVVVAARGGRADRRARVPVGAAAGPRRRRVARRRDVGALRADARRRRARRGPAAVGLGLGRRSRRSTSRTGSARAATRSRPRTRSRSRSRPSRGSSGSPSTSRCSPRRSARLLGGARDDPYRAVVAAGFVAVVVHTWMYAAFLEDPVTWTLLAVGAVLARQPREPPGGVRGRARSRAARTRSRAAPSAPTPRVGRSRRRGRA